MHFENAAHNRQRWATISLTRFSSTVAGGEAFKQELLEFLIFSLLENFLPVGKMHLLENCVAYIASLTDSTHTVC